VLASVRWQLGGHWRDVSDCTLDLDPVVGGAIGDGPAARSRAILEHPMRKCPRGEDKGEVWDGRIMRGAIESLKVQPGPFRSLFATS
jgi:hypothetical protein